jgi:hypothetical protein
MFPTQRRLWLAAVLLAATPAVMAGPPLNTGDTDILDPGTWEFIVAATLDERDLGDTWELPGGEVTYGISANTQTTLAFSRVVVDLPDESSKSDFGPFAAEFAWRFLSSGNWTAAIAPNYVFPINGSSQRRGTAASVRVATLPLIVTYAADKWFLTGEGSYGVASEGSNSIGYGLATGYAINDRFTALAEINGGESDESGADDRELNWRIGGTWQYSDTIALLAAFGGRLLFRYSVQHTVKYQVMY